MQQRQIQNQSEISYESLECYQEMVNEFLDLVFKKIDQLQTKCSSVAKLFNNDQQIQSIAEVFDKVYLEQLIEQIQIMENQIKCGISEIQIEKSESNNLLEKCQMLFEQKQYQESINLLNSLDQNNNDKVLFWKAKNLHKQNKMQEAQNLYQKAIQINVENERAYNNLGVILLQVKKYQEAIKLFETSLELNPNNECAYLNKGVALMKLDKYEDALIELQIALDINPLFEVAYLYIKETLVKMNFLQLAMYYIKKAIRMFPDNHRFYYEIGILLSQNTAKDQAKANYQEAIIYFDIALSLRKLSPYLIGKSKVLLLLDQKEQAQNLYQEGINLGYGLCDQEQGFNEIFNSQNL